LTSRHLLYGEYFCNIVVPSWLHRGDLLAAHHCLNIALDSLLPLLRTGALRRRRARAGPLRFALNAVWTLSNWPAGVLADRVGRGWAAMTGYALMGVAWLLFPLAPSLFAIYMLYSLYCLGNSMGFYASVFALDVAPERFKVLAVGFFDAIMYSGSALGDGAGGMLWQRWGARSPSSWLPWPFSWTLSCWRWEGAKTAGSHNEGGTPEIQDHLRRTPMIYVVETFQLSDSAAFRPGAVVCRKYLIEGKR